MTGNHPVRIGIQQRVLPSYRIPFFDALADTCPDGVGIFAGKPRPEEALDTGAQPIKAELTCGRNIHLFSGLFYLCWQKGLMEWLQNWRPDVLIMEANPRYLLSRRAINWMREQGGSVIGWGLGSPTPAGITSAIRLKTRRHFIRQFDVLITYSQAGAAEYASLGFPKERIFTAPNAVAPRPVHSLPLRPERYKAGRPVILFVGRLQARKRADILIRACSTLPAASRPLLWIVGDGPLRRTLEDLASSVFPETRFYGAQHGADLENLLREADLFVLPGTGGLAVQQAMSFGLPVIVGEADGTQSDLVRLENGWRITDMTVEHLSQLLFSALQDIKRLREMGEASYDIVKNEINLENMVAAFWNAIQKATDL